MDDRLRSSASGRELAALRRAGGTAAMLNEASGPDRRRAADALLSPAPPTQARRKRLRRARSCFRAHEIKWSAIQ
jgi:hypothetical protein